jgi:molecular chaperone IbpA
MKEYLPAHHPWVQQQFETPKSAPQKSLASFFNDMFFLGFQDQVSRWNYLSAQGKPASFPPYNLLKVDDNTYKVELAVAGFSKEDIEITVERDQLVVASKDNLDEEDDTVVYQGIAKRKWRQNFILGEYFEVASATMKDGLLTITVKRNVPEEAKPKVIKIK